MPTIKQNELLGAMIGLVRAVSKNEKTVNTDKYLLEGIQALRSGKDTDELIERIREEKFVVVPNCRYCAMPCGSTADADMETAWKAGEAVVSVKRKILDCLLHTVWDIEDETMLYFLHKGLFVLGEDETPEALHAFCNELENI